MESVSLLEFSLLKFDKEIYSHFVFYKNLKAMCIVLLWSSMEKLNVVSPQLNGNSACAL